MGENQLVAMGLSRGGVAFLFFVVVEVRLSVAGGWAQRPPFDQRIAIVGDGWWEELRTSLKSC